MRILFLLLVGALMYNLLGFFPSMIICIVGYFLSEN